MVSLLKLDGTKEIDAQVMVLLCSESMYSFHILLFTHFPSAGASNSQVGVEWLHIRTFAAKWVWKLVTYLVAALSNSQKI